MFSRFSFEGGGPENFVVLLGEHDRSEPDSQSHRLIAHVEEIVIHERYVGSADFWRNDIALIKLKQDIVFNKYICPVCLPPDSSTDDLVNCYATGWGRQSGRFISTGM